MANSGGGVKRIVLDEEAIILSTERTARLLGVTRKALSDWAAKGCPKEARGRWNLEEVLRWSGRSFGEHDGEEDELEVISLQEQKIRAEIRYKEAMGELTEIKRDFASGKYLEREVVEVELRRFFVVFKTAMRAIPRRMAAFMSKQIDPAEARRMEKQMAETVDKALGEFAKSMGVRP